MVHPATSSGIPRRTLPRKGKKTAPDPRKSLTTKGSLDGGPVAFCPRPPTLYPPTLSHGILASPANPVTMSLSIFSGAQTTRNSPRSTPNHTQKTRHNTPRQPRHDTHLHIGHGVRKYAPPPPAAGPPWRAFSHLMAAPGGVGLQICAYDTTDTIYKLVASLYFHIISTFIDSCLTPLCTIICPMTAPQEIRGVSAGYLGDILPKAALGKPRAKQFFDNQFFQ